eukprot:jgi/Phyca11/563273/estExt2_Genewise1.C_PHYCAscaffold_110516
MAGQLWSGGRSAKVRGFSRVCTQTKLAGASHLSRNSLRVYCLPPGPKMQLKSAANSQICY